ncbi:phosphoserine transaminase [Methyloterricola oryzae]|uniref:phosphoserine transaminase n=1 Tax=Methyloterricola oryzae TaxID=1495050 RepID=UPI0005EAC8D1|nr:phosphoserine transaminase [Methyloterricola oryzae]
MLTPNQTNFSGGPGALPETVLQQLQEAMLAVPGVGLSILGISHRSDWFAGVVAELEGNVRRLMGLSDDYHVLFLQGGATQQFSMLAMNLLAGKTSPADYVLTGYWSGKALPEARREGPVRVVWDGAADGFRRLPRDEEMVFSPEAPYLHYVSNETVEGLQFRRILGRDEVPRVCDMSSDFLSFPADYQRFAMIYAHAQKNIGPAGVTVVIVKDEVLKGMPDHLPSFLNYHTQKAAHSIYNTPPVFAMYVVLLVTRWLLEEIGGLANMDAINTRKANRLYQALDDSDGFYIGRAAVPDRSRMNVVFNLRTPQLEAQFLEAAEAAGFSGLKGHRSIGGIRASIYNGLELPAVESLVDFMDAFRQRAMNTSGQGKGSAAAPKVGQEVEL